MSKKVLAWIDDGHINYGVCNSLQSSGYQLYAVFDVNHITKNFYKNQDKVQFKKTWFWREHISGKPHKPDMEYLTAFEKKYDINLWKLAYMERRFLHFNEFHKFTRDEILSVTEDECKIFEKIIDEVNPDFLIIGVTDLHKNLLFKTLCELKGVRVLMLYHTRFVTRSIISRDYDSFDILDDGSESKRISKQDTEKFIESNNPRAATDTKFVNRAKKLGMVNLLRRSLETMSLMADKEYRQYYENWGRTKLNYLKSKEFPLTHIIKRNSRQSFLDKHATQNPNLGIPFVYYPLQHEPERTILLDAPFHTQQIDVITNVSKSLPVQYQLYVKEHFSMRTEAWRDTSFYKQILSLPNVTLVHPSVDSKSLIQNCSLVATITGTSALEAGFHNKPAIVFADASFSYLPFINKVTDIEKLPDIIKESLTAKFDYSSIQGYVDLVEKNSIPINLMDIIYDISDQLHRYGGSFREVAISEPQMNKFLTDHKTFFDSLASEFINKIQIDSRKTII